MSARANHRGRGRGRGSANLTWRRQVVDGSADVPNEGVIVLPIDDSSPSDQDESNLPIPDAPVAVGPTDAPPPPGIGIGRFLSKAFQTSLRPTSGPPPQSQNTGQNNVFAAHSTLKPTAHSFAPRSEVLKQDVTFTEGTNRAKGRGRGRGTMDQSFGENGRGRGRATPDHSEAEGGRGGRGIRSHSIGEGGRGSRGRGRGRGKGTIVEVEDVTHRPTSNFFETTPPVSRQQKQDHISAFEGNSSALEKQKQKIPFGTTLSGSLSSDYSSQPSRNAAFDTTGLRFGSQPHLSASDTTKSVFGAATSQPALVGGQTSVFGRTSQNALPNSEPEISNTPFGNSQNQSTTFRSFQSTTALNQHQINAALGAKGNTSRDAGHSPATFETTLFQPSKSSSGINTSRSRSGSPSIARSPNDLEMLNSEGEAERRKRRFGNAKGKGTLDGKGLDGAEGEVVPNRYLEMKAARGDLRKSYIKRGLIPDPNKPMTLAEAIDMVPECYSMCPEFEIEEREYQGAADLIWECFPGTQKVDRRKAVKAFHRPAAGNEAPLPIDIRPPEVLKKTLDYLFHEILPQDPEMARSHNFIRDRTRAIRQDFTVLRDRGLIAQECHERIARYHILILHQRRGMEGFEDHIELEQLRKVLQSLIQFYDDTRKFGEEISPHEPEFRAYSLASHIRSAGVIRATESLPLAVQDHPYLQDMLEYHKLVQTTNETRSERGRRPANSEASLNGFSRFFKRLRRPTTGFLMACLLEIHFDDVRRSGIKSLKRSYMENHKYLDLEYIIHILAFDDADHAKTFLQFHGLQIVEVDGQEYVELHRKVEWMDNPTKTSQIGARGTKKIIDPKKGTKALSEILDYGTPSASTPLTTTEKSSPKVLRKVSSTIKPTSTLESKVQPGFPLLQRSPSSKHIVSPSIFGKSHMLPLPATATKKTIGSSSLFSQGQSEAPSYAPTPHAVPQTPIIEQPTFVSAFPSITVSKATPLLPTPSFTPVTTISTAPTRKLSVHSTPKASTSSLNPIKANGGTSKLDAKMVNYLAQNCVDKILDFALSRPIEFAADEAMIRYNTLQDTEAALRAGQVTEAICDSLIGAIVNEIAFKQLRDIRTSRRAWSQWNRLLKVKRKRRAEVEERMIRFKSDVSSLGSTQRRKATEDIEERRWSKGKAIAAADDEIPELLKEAQNLRARIWTKSTFYLKVAQHINSLFQRFRSSSTPRWKVLILSNPESATSAWLGCKFEIPPFPTFPNVFVEVEFAESVQEVEERDHVGLVILDCTIDDDCDDLALWNNQRRRLQLVGETLANETIYVPGLLVLFCTAEVPLSSTADVELRIIERLGLQRPQEIWGGHVIRCLPLKSSELTFAHDIDTLLRQVDLRSNLTVTSATELAYPFLQEWRQSLSEAIDIANFSPLHSLHIVNSLVDLFIKSLQSLADLVERSVVRNLGKSSGVALSPPPFSLFTSLSHSDDLVQRIQKYTDQSYFLGFGDLFESVVANSEVEIAGSFLDSLAICLVSKLADVRVSQIPTERNQHLNAFCLQLEKDLNILREITSALELQHFMRSTKKRNLEEKEIVQSPTKKVRLEDLRREMMEVKERYLISRASCCV